MGGIIDDYRCSDNTSDCTCFGQILLHWLLFLELQWMSCICVFHLQVWIPGIQFLITTATSCHLTSNLLLMIWPFTIVMTCGSRNPEYVVGYCETSALRSLWKRYRCGIISCVSMNTCCRFRLEKKKKKEEQEGGGPFRIGKCPVVQQNNLASWIDRPSGGSFQYKTLNSTRRITQSSQWDWRLSH